MARKEFPKELYITREPTEEYLLANETLDESVRGSSDPVEIAEYTLTKTFMAQAVVQIIEEENEGEEA